VVPGNSSAHAMAVCFTELTYRGSRHAFIGVIITARRDIFLKSTTILAIYQQKIWEVSRTSSGFFLDLYHAAEVSRCQRGESCAS
jgi:hypothetical protein